LDKIVSSDFRILSNIPNITQAPVHQTDVSRINVGKAVFCNRQIEGRISEILAGKKQEKLRERQKLAERMEGLKEWKLFKNKGKKSTWSYQIRVSDLILVNENNGLGIENTLRGDISC
jgi:hypothetical protein